MIRFAFYGRVSTEDQQAPPLEARSVADGLSWRGADDPVTDWLADDQARTDRGTH